MYLVIWVLGHCLRYTENESGGLSLFPELSELRIVGVLAHTQKSFQLIAHFSLCRKPFINL